MNILKHRSIGIFIFINILFLSGFQFANAQCVYSVSTNSLNFPGSGGDEYVYIDASYWCQYYQVYSSDSWIYAWTNYYGNNVQIYVEPNYSDSPREGYVIIDYHYIYIYQEGSCSEMFSSPGEISGSNSVCAGSYASFSISPVEGAYYYSWYLNGNATGQYTTNATFYFGSAQYAYISVTAYHSCGESQPSTKYLTVQSIPQITTHPTARTVCSGNSAVFSVAAIGGNSYQWQYNSGSYWQNIAGATGTSYSTSTNVSMNGYQYRCQVGNSCTTTNSNSALLTVNPSLPVSVTISGNGTLCNGLGGGFSASVTNGGTSPSFQWLLNNNPVTNNTVGVPVYIYAPNTALNNGDQVSCRVTSNATCGTNNPATSNIITITRKNPVTPYIGITSSPGITGGDANGPYLSICNGVSVTFTANSSNGGSYQWYSNGGVITGQTGSTYTSSTLTNDQRISVTASGISGCVTSATASSANVRMIVTPMVTPTVSISPVNPGICAGSNLTFTATPINGGNPSFVWKVNGIVQSGQTGTIFSSTGFTNGQSVSVEMTSHNTCQTTNFASASSGTITVNPNLPVSVTIVSNGTSLCNGRGGAFRVFVTNGGTSPSYQWFLNNNPVTNNTVGVPADVYVPNTALNTGDQVSCRVTSNAACATNNPATSGILTITRINPVTPTISITSSPGITGGDANGPYLNICSGVSVTFTANSTLGGSYQWYSNGGVIGGQTGRTYTSSTLTNDQRISVKASGIPGCVTSTTASSANVRMIVAPTVGSPGAIQVSGGTEPTDILTNGTTTTTYSANATNNTGFNWSIDNQAAGTINATTGVMTWANGFYGIVTIRVTANGCNGPSAQVTRNVTVNQNLSVMDADYLQGADIPDPETRALDTSYLVGATNGSLNVNPMGGASYTIPLEVLPGVDGLSPSLSLVYSSSSGPGVAGFGWQIGGLSVISRGPQTVYHDGSAKGVDLDINDRFYMDGQRLVTTTSSSYGDGSALYQTENDIFTRVTPQITDTYGPAWFKAETKSGLVYEYGSSSGSKQMISGYSQVVNWYVSKVYDLFGNQANFSYIRDHYSIYPAEITYGQNTITFYYKQRIDRNATFLKGIKIEQRLLLDKITVKYNSNVVKTYEFKQSYQGSSYNSYSILNEVIEYGIGSSRLNSTAISYQIPANVTFSQTTYNTTHAYITYKSKLCPGDFNGDGKTDFLCLPTDASWTGMRVYLGDGNDNFPTSFSSTTSIDLSQLQDIRSLDINGDSKDDILYEVGSSSSSTFYYMLCNGSSFTQPYSITALGSNAFTGLSGKRRRGYDKQENDNELTGADYNDDGVNDIFLNDPNGNWQIWSFVDSYGQLTSSSYLLGSGTISTLAKEVLSGDFNGDGKADIWSFEDTGVKIYTFTGTTLSLLYSSSWPSNKHFYTLGDFNADGKVDVFLYGYGKGGTEYDWGDWQIQLSTGVGFETNYIPKKKNNLKNDYVRLGDFNGDGATDIMVSSSDQSWTGTYFYIIKNNGTDFYTHSLPYYPASSHNYYLGDYNGDGHTDFICTDGVSPWWTGYQVYKTIGNTSFLMEKVANGLGLLTKLTYTKLSQASSLVYQRGTGATYPVSDFQGPLSVVSSVQVDNGKATMNTQEYYYEGAKIHLQGKGFLGYSKTRTSDVSAGIESESISGYDVNHFYPQLLKTLSKRTGTDDTINKATNAWSKIVLDASKKRIFPYLQSSTQTNKLTGQSVTVSTQYDDYGNPTLLTKSYLNGPRETTTNTYNNTVSSSQWLLGRPTATTIQYSDNSTTITRSGTRVFDSNNNNLISETWYAGTNNQITNTYNYNTNGTLKSETATANGVSRLKSCTYESDNIRIHTTTDPLSHVTTNTYDSYGRLCSQQDHLGNTATYQYDNLGRQYFISSSNGSQTTTVYAWEDPTAEPNLTRYSVMSTGNNGSQTKKWFDKLGRVIRSDVKGFDGTMIYTSTVYNTKGQVESVSDPYYSTGTASWNTFIYDNYGRETNQSRPSGNNSSWVYSGSVITETTAEKTFYKTTSSDGTITSATDAGGTITYTYYPDGRVKTITTPGGITTIMQYDLAGNQIQLVDPSAGTVTYTYNGFGELTSQTDAKNQTTSLSYNPEGTISQKVTPEGTTNYTYNTNKQISGITSPGGVSCSFIYDSKGRVTVITETIPGSSSFTTTNTYDDLGRNSTITHPSGITEINSYNSYGYLSSVSAGDTVRWTITGMNARQQVTSGLYGSSLVATFGYDSYGFPTSSVTGTIQNYTYSFNNVTGNLNWRKNNKYTDLREDFHYDNLDRLKDVYMGTTMTLDMAYESNKGGIITKSDVGTMLYNASSNPYAISDINPSTGLTPGAKQSISYTSFKSVSKISENNYTASFTYNPDNERAKMDVQLSGNSILTRWYIGSGYIKETAGSVTKEYTFIGGDSYSAPVVAITQNGNTTYYNLLRDYLGNITHVVNAKTNFLITEYSFDAWGRMRDPSTWANYNPGSEPALFVAGRGFTGHEHLPWFNLINMNGRAYDPLTGTFISPDPVVQDPGNTQSYNRYAYCLNNPLRYTDPSGYTWFSNFGDWLGSTGKTIVTTVVAVAVGVAVACIPGLNAVGIAFVGGMLSGATSGALGAALNGGDVFSGAVQGGIMGAGIGLATLGAASAIGCGLDNIYIGKNIVGTSSHLTIRTFQTYANRSLASYLPEVGSLINGVSNTALASGITGGSFGGVINLSYLTSSMKVKHIPSPPVYMQSYLSYNGSTLNWIDEYIDGSCRIIDSWNAISGGRYPLPADQFNGRIPNGLYNISSIRLDHLGDGYCRDGVDFYAPLDPQFTLPPNRTGGLQIHPEGGEYGTNGCIGIQSNAAGLLRFYNKMYNYIKRNGIMKVNVYY